MDPITLWTAVGSITMVLTIGGGVFNYIRNGDKAMYDSQFNSLTNEINQVKTEIVAKASKDELDKSVLRLERDIQTVRTEQKTGHAEIRGDIKDMRIEQHAMRAELISLFRDEHRKP